MSKASKKAKYKDKNKFEKSNNGNESNALRTILNPKNRKYLYLIFLIGFVVFLPVLFNGFAWDDFQFIIDNAQVHQLNPSLLFGQSVFNSGLFYRPIPATFFALEYSLFGQGAFFYHFIQLPLHFVSAYLIFIYFSLFFEERVSFFLALVFLVHPINVESVAWIAGGTPSELFFIPGMIAFLLATDRNPSRKKLVLISILLLLSMFAKETGFLFLLAILSCSAEPILTYCAYGSYAGLNLPFQMHVRLLLVSSPSHF